MVSKEGPVSAYDELASQIVCLILPYKTTSLFTRLGYLVNNFVMVFCCSYLISNNTNNELTNYNTSG